MNQDSDSENNEGMISPPSKRRIYQQIFRDAWLENPNYALWLEKMEDIYKAKCKVCNKIFVARKCHIDKHKTTTMHILNLETLGRGEADASSNFARKVKQAEIRLTLDIVDNNRSFNSFKHDVAMLNLAVEDSKIVKHMTLKKSKISAIIKNVINRSIVSKNIKAMHNKFFSVFIDESNDTSDTKNLCILVRYIDRDTVQTHLLDLVCIKEGSGENLFKYFMHILSKHDLSVNNIVGICVDNANVMLGKQNSIVSRLLLKNNEIAVFGCIYHSIYSVACRACQALPMAVEDFLHLVYSYFSRSTKRKGVLENIQQIMNMAQQKVYQPSQIRWLAQLDCIKAILTQWTILHSLFAEATMEKESAMAAQLFEKFNCPFTKAYLQFLSYVLSLMTKFNVLLQSSGILIHSLLSEFNKLLRYIAINFVKPHFIDMTNLHEMDIQNENNLCPLEEIFIGEEAKDTIREIRSTRTEENSYEIKEFYKNIQKFYKLAFDGIRERIPFNEQFLNSLNFLNPQTALGTTHNENQIYPILEKFSSKFDKKLVINEWHVLPSHFTIEEKEEMIHTNVAEFWYRISKTKDIAGEYAFAHIAKVAELCLSLPYSNADVEKFFSIIAETKTKDRNRLKLDTISALTRIKFDFKKKNQDCTTYPITEDMFELFNYNMYKKEPIPEDLVGILLPDETDNSESEYSDN